MALAGNRTAYEVSYAKLAGIVTVLAGRCVDDAVAAEHGGAVAVAGDGVDAAGVAVQLTEHIDVVDWEHSTFERSGINPKSVFFDRLVLMEPAGGLPPLFRVPAQKSLLLISAEARRALEAAGIAGIKFLSLPTGARHVDAASGIH